MDWKNIDWAGTGASLWDRYAINAFSALAVLVLGWFAARFLRRVLRSALERGGMDVTVARFLSSMGYIVTMSLVVISAIGRLGISTASFAAVVGAAGLAIGLALQGSLSNFASGVLLVFFRPFKVGDYVEAAGVSGAVEAIGVFSTTLRTPDNKLVIVGNAEVYSGSITNYSSSGRRRIDLVIGIGYEDDIDAARKIVANLLQEEPRVLPTPEPTIQVIELGSSSVDLGIRPWVNTPDYWGTRCDLLESIKKSFDQAEISIPYPQRTVHVPNLVSAASGRSQGLKMATEESSRT